MICRRGLVAQPRTRPSAAGATRRWSSAPGRAGHEALQFAVGPQSAPRANFLAEKNLTVPTVDVDLARLDQRSEGFTALNPFQRIPVLRLDDGVAISS